MEQYTYIFSGKVHPENNKFTMSKSQSIQCYMNNESIDELVLSLTITIIDSIITVKCLSSINHFESKMLNFEEMKIIIDEAVRTIVDSYCYIDSCCYEVEISTIECKELGVSVKYGVKGEFDIVKSQEQINSEIQKISIIFEKSNNSFMKDVFADFRRSIKYPKMTAGFCYRSLETIRKHCFRDKDVKCEWNKFREEFALNQYDFEEITRLSEENRHGKYPSIDGQTRGRIFKFTRTIIEKVINKLYLESKKDS